MYNTKFNLDRFVLFHDISPQLENFCMKRHVFIVGAIVCAFIISPVSGGYLYSLNANGQMSVNANTINNYPIYALSNDSAATYLAGWRDLVIVNGNQHALRADGLILTNGVAQWKLKASGGGWIWNKFAVSNNRTYSLRQDGAFATNATIAVTLPRNGFFFNGIVVKGSTTYCLRTDGSIFKNTSTTPVLVFNAGNGVFGKPDGKGNDTLWITLKFSPDGRYLYALRCDGILYRAEVDGGPTTIEQVATLPFPTNTSDYSEGDLYWELEFNDLSGEWVVLRLDGAVFRQSNTSAPSDDFPGTGNLSSDAFLDLAVYGNRYYAVRSDGSLFAEGGTNALLKLPGSEYGMIRFSPVPPNLAGQNNFPPYVVEYNITANTNLPVRLPVVTTDIETRAEDLVVEMTSLPEGAVWNPSTREISWSNPMAKGNFTISYNVTDQAGNTTSIKSKIKIRYPDLNPKSNKPPYVTKIKNATALVGQEYRLHIPSGDPDNDPVTVVFDAAAYPFTAGASYDAVSGEFIWTPVVTDVAEHTIPFTFTDGVKSKTLKLKLAVKIPIYTDLLP
jgi:hypothetical protein